MPGAFFRGMARLDAVKQQVAGLQAMQKHEEDLLAEVEQAILAQAFRGEL